MDGLVKQCWASDSITAGEEKRKEGQRVCERERERERERR